MSDKTWFILYTKAPTGLYRYAIEYPIFQEPADDTPHEEYRKAVMQFKNGLEVYFKSRTGVKEEVLSIDEADFISAYKYQEQEPNSTYEAS